MNPLVKKKLSILIHLANIDGEFAKVEKSFIYDIAERNGVSKDEINALIEQPDSIGSLGALSYNKAVEYMCDSLSLMIIDEKVLPSEIILCEDIALRLGFHKKDIDTIIDALKNNHWQSAKQIEQAIRALPHSAKIG
jgi:hypothetical protein